MMPQLPPTIPPPQRATHPTGRLIVRKGYQATEDEKIATETLKDQILPGITREQLKRKMDMGNAEAAAGFLFDLEKRLGLPPREFFPMDPGVM
jgi:hypothetical protein